MPPISRADTRTVATIRKNNQETVHVRTINVGGAVLIDIRAFASSTRNDGEPVPTRAGVCLSRAKIRDLIAALEAAEAA